MEETMTKKEKAAFGKSYHAYKRDWYSWKIKGYAMKTEAPMSETEYLKHYNQVRQLAVDKGNPELKKDIGSRTARTSRLLGKTYTKTLYETIKEQKGKNAAFDVVIEEKFKNINALKANLHKYSFTVGGTTYYGKQAIYLEMKQLFGVKGTRDVFGY
jgi:hypothetical protein